MVMRLPVLRATTFVVLAGSAIAISALAQESSPTPADSALSAERAGRTDEQNLSAFLTRKQVQQEKRSAGLARRGTNRDEAELRQIYRALGTAKPRPNTALSPASLSALETAMETDAVQLIQSLDITPQRVKQLASAGFDPLVASAAYIRGSATLVQQALLADVVALVTVGTVRNEDLGDGFRSTVVFDVVDPITGRIKGSQVALRQMSGDVAGGGTVEVFSDIKAQPGQSYLLMLSSGLYQQMADESGGKPASGPVDFHVLFGSSYTVSGDTLVPSFPGAEPRTSLSALKTELSELSRARGTADNQPN